MRTSFTGSIMVDRPIAVTMVFIAAVVFGYFSVQTLPITLMPDVSYPTLTVRTQYDGAAPEEVENDISRKIEEALGVISGLNNMTSISRVGVSDVVLNFDWGVDISIATQDVLERLDRVRLSRDVEKPIILHFDPSLDPVMVLNFAGIKGQYQGEEGLKKLRRLADINIKRILEPLDGVAAVRVRGGLEEEIQIRLNEQKLTRSQLTIADVSSRLAKENINTAGGRVIEGGVEYTVRTLNQFASLDEIKRTIITYIDDKPITVADVATVTSTYKKREIITRSNGEESVQIDIYKEADTNMVALSKNIIALIGVPSHKAKPSNKKLINANTSSNSKRVNANPTKKQRGNRKGRRGGAQKTVKLAQSLFEQEKALLTVAADRSVFIDNAINEVKQTAWVGALLAVLVLFLFLQNLKSTIIIALSIPISILITFTPMGLSGISLNMMSLGGLALGIGMLVDASIVVLESIYRCKDEGDSTTQAVIRGTQEVRGAVCASILTSIAVFFPIVFVEGMAGQIFSDLVITVVLSLLISLVVALSFIPMLASRPDIRYTQKKRGHYGIRLNKGLESLKVAYAQLKQRQQQRSLLAKCMVVPVIFDYFKAMVSLLLTATIFCMLALIKMVVVLIINSILYLLNAISPFLTWMGRHFSALLGRISHWYQRSLTVLLLHPKWVISAIVILFLVTIGVFKQLKTELLPATYQGEYTVEVNLPIGSPLDSTLQRLRHIENKLQHGHPNIKNVLVTYGFDITNVSTSNEGEHTAKFRVLLKPTGTIKQAEKRSMEKVRVLFNDIPDIALHITQPVLFSQTLPIQVEVYANDLSQLKKTTDRIKNKLVKLSALSDVETRLQKGAPEIQIVYDRNKILQLDLNIESVAQMVRDLVKGNEATLFNKIDRRIPITVQLQEHFISRVEDIKQLIINPKSDRPIPLSAVASFIVSEGPSEIRRINNQRVGVINANLGDASLGDAVKEIEHVLDNHDWQDGAYFAITGQKEEWDNTKFSLVIALLLSVFLVYIIMASQFESLLHPLMIMFSIPLAFLGSVLALWWLDMALSIVVLLGVMMLIGLAVNNAIVLVDYTNTLRTKNIALQQAVIQAGAVRLRPILMTTATTILGLLPMAIGLGEGAEIRMPMAITVIFGLLSSTCLTLFIIPCIYFYFENNRLMKIAEPYAHG